MSWFKKTLKSYFEDTDFVKFKYGDKVLVKKGVMRGLQGIIIGYYTETGSYYVDFGGNLPALNKPFIGGYSEVGHYEEDLEKI